jgi:hypothetical protein
MTAEPPEVHRCPSCGAVVRFGDPWCTLCYTDLRPPAPPPDPEPEPEQQPGLPTAPAYPPLAGPDPLTAPLEVVPGAVSGPTWPCTRCGAINPMARDTCAACGLSFLSGVRELDPPLLELPVVGDIAKLNRGMRLALAAGVVMVVVMLTLLLGLLFG